MYYKILNKYMRHYKMLYHEGLNTNCEETRYDGDCEHGLFFADEQNILKFCNYGSVIADVTLPKGEHISKCIGKYKSHQIILSNIRPLWTVETFQELLESGVDIHVGEDWVLKAAVEHGYLDIVKFLVVHGADIHTGHDYALRFAAKKGHLETVQYLVERGADIHAEDDYVLKLAADTGHTDVVEYLKSLA